jgi:hypothetical protein
MIVVANMPLVYPEPKFQHNMYCIVIPNKSSKTKMKQCRGRLPGSYT